MDSQYIKGNLLDFYKDISKNSNAILGNIGPFEYIIETNSIWPNTIFLSNQEINFNYYELYILKKGIKNNKYPTTLLLDDFNVTNDTLSVLRKTGFVPASEWINMEFAIGTLGSIQMPALDVRVLTLNDVSELNDWIGIVNSVLFSKGNLTIDLFKNGIRNNLFKLLILYYKELPAATALLYLGKDAGIYMVATIPLFRKKGLGKYIVNVTHRLAASLNYNKTVLHSTKQGLPLYQSLGYVPKGKMILFCFIDK